MVELRYDKAASAFVFDGKTAHDVKVYCFWRYAVEEKDKPWNVHAMHGRPSVLALRCHGKLRVHWVQSN